MCVQPQIMPTFELPSYTKILILEIRIAVKCFNMRRFKLPSETHRFRISAGNPTALTECFVLALYRDSSVGIVTRLQAGRSWLTISSQGKRFLSPSLFIDVYPGYFAEAKRP